MSLIHGLLGNATEITPDQALPEVSHILASGESVRKAYKVLRDGFFFTDKRLILVDRQGVTGHKVEFFSIPYKSVTMFSVENAGHLDLDSDLKIFLRGQGVPLIKKFKKGELINDVARTLAEFVL